MKFTKITFLVAVAIHGTRTAAIRTAAIRTAAITDNCPGTESFSVSFQKGCSYASLEAEIESLLGEDLYTGCTLDADGVLSELLGGNNNEATVDALCISAYESSDVVYTFDDVTRKGYQFNNEYFSGGTKWNYEIETNDGENELKSDAARVKDVYHNEAKSGIIELPMDLPSFNPSDVGTCELNAAFCCWVQDRQAKDGKGNGNCNTPYDSNCVDKDPSDNANLCYVDHDRAAVGTHVAGGFSIYGDVENGKENIEGDIHCHGFAWAESANDPISVYKGNNLFFVSMYDHMYTRGYVRNVPGATMCACAETMPVVTRADCTQMEVTETFKFDFDATSNQFSAELCSVDDIDFQACEGANGTNNDLEAYYERLVNEEKAKEDNLTKLRKTLVGKGGNKCNTAIESFLATKGIDLMTK